MEALFSILVGLFFSAAVYLILSRFSIRIMLGIEAANPLPQALILTAIVISFSFLAFLLVLTYRAYQDLRTDDTGEMRVAEPDERPLPPLGY